MGFTIYDVEGKKYVAFGFVKKKYGITFEELTNLINKGKVRCRDVNNPNNNKMFKAYNLVDCAKYQKQKKQEEENLWFR